MSRSSAVQLKQAGGGATESPIALISVLLDISCRVSIEQVFRPVLQHGQAIDLVTVYRILYKLEG